jgi:hypothetical protein
MQTAARIHGPPSGAGEMWTYPGGWQFTLTVIGW